MIDACVDRSQDSPTPSTTPAIVRSQITEYGPKDDDDGQRIILSAVPDAFDERPTDPSHIMLMPNRTMHGEEVSHGQHAVNGSGKKNLTIIFIQLQRDDLAFDVSSDFDTAPHMVKHGNNHRVEHVLVKAGMQADEPCTKKNIFSTTSSPTATRILNYVVQHYDKWIHGTKITSNEISRQFFLSLLTRYQPIDRGRNRLNLTV